MTWRERGNQVDKNVLRDGKESSYARPTGSP